MFCFQKSRHQSVFNDLNFDSKYIKPIPPSLISLITVFLFVVFI